MLTTTYRTLFCLTTVCLIAQLAIAETMQVKLLNPDGSAAVDAKAVAIMKPGVRVDSNLKELPSLLMLDGSSTAAVPNALGTLQFDSKALAVLAQSPSGFVFIPLPLAAREVKLRPWAKLKIDLSTLAPKVRQPQRLTVMWENCFAGYPPKTRLPVQGDDPFGTAAANEEVRFDLLPTIMNDANNPFDSPEPKIDWRFDPLVMWSLGSEVMPDQVVNVPPGEVTVVLSDEDLHAADAEHSVPIVGYSPVRTMSGQQAMFKLPETENIRGKLIENSLPEWSKSSDNLFVCVRPHCDKLPAEVAKLFTRPTNARDTSAILDELARRYASDVGMQYRYELLVPGANARVQDDGSFELSNVPVGKYTLELFGPKFHASVNLKQRGDASNQSITVELTGKPSPLDIGEVERVEQVDPPLEPSKPPTNPAPPVQQPAEKDAMLGGADEGFSANPIETAEQTIRSALLRQVDVEFNGLSFRVVIDEFSSATSAPIRLSVKKLEPLMVSEDTPINMTLPRMTLHSALRNILSSLSDELTFTIRDEVLLITTKEDAAQDRPIKLQTTSPADLDSGDAFLTYWLKTAETPNTSKTDPAALRKALQEHLEKEFDTKQQARRAELDGLRTLLKQSEDWLNTRQSRRAEIVGKRVDELLGKARK